MSPDAELYYLDGLIHEQWARLAIDSDVSAPMPHEGGENAKQKLFECGWVRVALQGTGGLSVEYSDGATLHEKQLSRLITLAIGSGAKFLARECGDKIEVFWR